MKILFVIAGTLTGFFIGVFFGAITIPKGSGLAGPAVVLEYGLVAAMIGSVVAFWLNSKFSASLRKKVTAILFLICIIPLLWMFYRLKTDRPNDSESLPKPRPVTPVKVQMTNTGAHPHFWV